MTGVHVQCNETVQFLPFEKVMYVSLIHYLVFVLPLSFGEQIILSYIRLVRANSLLKTNDCRK